MLRRLTTVHQLRLLGAAFLVTCTLGLGGAPASAREPCQFLDDTAANGPCFVIGPSAGPVGTRVHFRVRVAPQHQGGWLGDWRRHPLLRMFKQIPQTDNSRCMFMVPGDPSHWHIVRLEPKNPQAAVNEKAVVGWLTIGEVGSCEGERPQRVTPGRYLLSNSRHHGVFARFRVLSGELPATGAKRFVASTALGGRSGALSINP